MTSSTPPKRKRKPEPRQPREFLRRDMRNIRLHLPATDYAAIRVGAKREFRNYGRRAFDGVEFPTPVVGYCALPGWVSENALEGVQTCLLTLTESWVEPLGAISSESLTMEGFPDDLKAFRRYFAARYPKGGFRPLANVIVYRVRPLTEADEEDFREAMWQRLYGQYR